MGSQWPCCWGERHSLSPPGRPALRSRKMRLRLWLRAPARRCPSPTSPPGSSRRSSTFRPSSASRCARNPIRSRNSSAASAPGPAPGRQRRDQPQQPAAHARSRLARLRLHHFARRLCRHQQPPDPGRHRHWHGRQRHGHHHRPQGIYRADRRPRRDLGPGAAQDRRPQSAVRPMGRQHPRPGRRLGARDRQSLRPRRHGHGRDHLGAPPRHHRRRRLRPLHPDRCRHQHGQ